MSLDADLYSEGLVLISSGLLSKWGFCDGDVLDDDLYEELEEIGFWEADLRSVGDPAEAFSLSDRALIRLVREYLLPVLDQDVEVIEIGSLHNPIRASKVDGVDVERCWYGDQPDPVLTPESVVVSTADVLRVCRELMASGNAMSKGPGTGCDDPREVHPHWCGFCGAQLEFSAVGCRTIVIVPPCLRCRSTDWRNEVDEMTAPDFREDP